MKRLLAYLIVVLGLGLTFNVNANHSWTESHYCIKKKGDDGKWPFYVNQWGGSGECPSSMKEVSKKKFETFKKIIDKKYIPKTTVSTTANNKNTKVEPSQTQKVAKKSDWRKEFELIQQKKNNKDLVKEKKAKNTIKYKRSNDITHTAYSIPRSGILQYFFGTTTYNDKEIIFILKNNKCFYGTNLSTIILTHDKPTSYDFPCRYEYSGDTIYASIGKNKKVSLTLDLKNKSAKSSTSTINKPITSYDKYKISYIAKKYKKTNLLNSIEGKEDQTQIVKTEPTVKPKKKTKVAKVEDNTQEEFKPKKTNQDNEAPVIEIAEVITVNDSSYEFKGKVTDKAKTIYVEVDGRSVEVKKGQFLVKGYSPVDKQISITAIDQWGNKSKPKLVNIIIDQKDTIVADNFEALDPSKIRSKSNKNRVALIIGIEKYDQTPDASFANLDAQYFYEYARKGFGISKSNIKLLVDEDANLVSSLGTLSKWLPGKIKSGETELIIFFAGHGLASNNGKELYLLPQDSDPDLLIRTALSRTELFKEIIALNPKSVTMFLDTCYSGVSRDEKTLLASARPVRIIADEQDTPNNFTIFSASQLDQISSGLKEAKHGIFSYYLMKGLEGKADVNKDKDITNGELLAYMDQNVAQKASELGRQQNPSLAGDPDKILMSYR